jgi:uncharacterized membrane protein YkvA (DUF1232 family)
MKIGKKIGKFSRAIALFQAFTRDAEEYHYDPQKAEELGRNAYERARRHRKGPLARVWDELMSFIRLIRAWAKGSYRHAPWKSLALIIGAILYFVSPLDAIPDIIPVLGFMDDAFIIAFVMRQVRKDIAAFRIWEASFAV